MACDEYASGAFNHLFARAPCVWRRSLPRLSPLILPKKKSSRAKSAVQDETEGYNGVRGTAPYNYWAWRAGPAMIRRHGPVVAVPIPIPITNKENK